MKRILPMLFLLSIMLVSCAQNRTVADFKKEGFGELDVVRAQSYFPKTAYQDNTFDIGLTLVNNAAYDAENVRVQLAGFDNAFVDFVHSQEQQDLIAGRSIFDQDGEEMLFQFQGQVKDLQGAAFKKQNYFLYLSYTSKMEFTPKPCIGPRQLYKNIQNLDCVIPESPVRYNGQGAPLAVETMEIIPPSDVSREIKFILTLRNRGKGKINTVRLEKALIANDELDCHFRGEAETATAVPLPDQKTVELVCTRLLETESRYTTTLFLSFSYDYQRVVQESLELKK